MTSVGLALVLGAAAVAVYAYLVYPLLLWLGTQGRPRRSAAEPET